MLKTKKAINPKTTDTIIGQGSSFEGLIRSEAGVHVEGAITGDVESAGNVVVGEKGHMKSNITARNIIIAGTVHGNVTAKEKLTILSSGSLYGNLSAHILLIEEGAVFNGNSKIEGKSVATSSQEPVPPKKSSMAG